MVGSGEFLSFGPHPDINPVLGSCYPLLSPLPFSLPALFTFSFLPEGLGIKLEGATCPAGALAEVPQHVLTPDVCCSSAQTLPFPAVSDLAVQPQSFSLPRLKFSL